MLIADAELPVGGESDFAVDGEIAVLAASDGMLAVLGTGSCREPSPLAGIDTAASVVVGGR
jgi:N-acetylglucosamine kinase-like BadF-type ATPase